MQWVLQFLKLVYYAIEKTKHTGTRKLIYTESVFRVQYSTVQCTVEYFEHSEISVAECMGMGKGFSLNSLNNRHKIRYICIVCIHVYDGRSNSIVSDLYP